MTDIATTLRDGHMGKRHVKNMLATRIMIGSPAVISAVAAVDFLSGIESTFDELIFDLQNVLSAADIRGLYLRTSPDGSTIDNGASAYAWTGTRQITTTVTAANSAGAAQIDLLAGGTMGNAANEVGVSGTVRIIRPNAAAYTQILSDLVYTDDSGNTVKATVVAQRLAAAVVLGARFLASSGNLASGVITAYGVKRT